MHDIKWADRFTRYDILLSYQILDKSQTYFNQILRNILKCVAAVINNMIIKNII